MKKSLLSVVAFFVFALAASAQTEKGSWLVGGNLGLNTAKNNTEISISPSAGYFFLHNFAAGINFDYSYSKVSYSKVTQLGVGPFARYYFGTMNIRPFADAELSYESQKTKDPASVTTVNGSSFFVGGGLAAFINRNVSVEALAGYKNTSIQSGPNTGGFNLRIGFQVYLSREQVEKIKERRF
jgi:hypothetical protein